MNDLARLPLSERWLWAPSSLPQPLRACRALLAVSASPLWGALMSCRRTLSRRLTPPQAPPCPTVCVGSPLIGGAGKTEVAAWCAQTLCDAGLRPLLLSRGYGRSSRRTLLLPKGPPWPPYTDTGDEPLMLAMRLQHTPTQVLVSAAPRLQTLRWARQHLPPFDAAILDDGLQDLSITYNLSICLLPPEAPRLRTLPTGPLREHVEDMFRYADNILPWIHSGAPPQTLPHTHPTPPQYTHDTPHTCYAIDCAQSQLNQIIIPIKNLPNRPNILLSALARNHNLPLLLSSLPSPLSQHIALPDHHPINAQKLLNKITDCNILTTPKDWPRLAPSLPPHLLPLTYTLPPRLTFLSTTSPSPRERLLSALSTPP